MLQERKRNAPDVQTASIDTFQANKKPLVSSRIFHDYCLNGRYSSLFSAPVYETGATASWPEVNRGRDNETGEAVCDGGRLGTTSSRPREEEETTTATRCR